MNMFIETPNLSVFYVWKESDRTMNATKWGVQIYRKLILSEVEQHTFSISAYACYLGSGVIATDKGKVVDLTYVLPTCW